MLVQHVLQRVVAERGSARGREDRVVGPTVALAQPTSQDADGVLAQRSATTLAPLALASHVRADAEHDVLAAKTCELRGAQPRLDGQHQKRPITTPRPGREVGRGEQGVNFDGRQKRDRTARISFAGHGQYALHHRAVFRRMQGHIAEEGVDGGQAHVAAAGAVLAFALEVIQEGPQQRRVKIRHRQVRGRLAQAPLGILQQQSKGVAVARDRVSAALTLLYESIHEERLHQRRQCADRSHGRCPCRERSTRRRA